MIQSLLQRFSTYNFMCWFLVLLVTVLVRFRTLIIADTFFPRRSSRSVRKNESFNKTTESTRLGNFDSNLWNLDENFTPGGKV